MNKVSQTVPEALIYEVINQRPIYYRGYKEYLQGTKKIEAIKTGSLLKSMIVSRLVFLLQTKLGLNYEILTNELGIQFSQKSWRAADIVIAKSEDIEAVEITDKYLNFPPEIVIEIDTKAALDEIENPLNYYHEKTDELLNFGVKKVIWIFSETQKVTIAQANKRWETADWEEDIEVMNGVFVNIEKLMKKRR